MKKHFIKIFLISLALFMVNIPNVKALCGDLIYDVIDLHINDNSITLKGWAFIHYTQNGYRRKNNAADEKSPTYQKIKIGLCDIENNNTCIYKKQNGNGYDFDEVMGIKKGNNFTQMDYTYQKIGFEIKFDFDEIKEKFNKTEETSLYFTIAATNDDFSSKYEKGECNGTELFNKVVGTERKKEEDNKYWVSEKMKILNDAISGKNSNETIEIEATGANKILYTGWHSSDGKKTRISWGQIYQYQGKRSQPSNLKSENPGEYKIKARKTTNKYQSTGEDWYYYTCANYNENNEYDDKFLNVYEYDGGYKFFNGSEFSRTITTKENIDNSFKATCSDNWIESWNRISYAKVYGETKLKIKIKSDKKCEVSKPSADSMECNYWTNLSSTCEELTVRNNNSSAVVKIEQNGYISNIFKSNLVNDNNKNDNNKYYANSYDGGWFKYGIVYRNELSWSIVSGNNDDNITEVMQDKIKELRTFIDNLTMNIEGLTDLSGTQLIKKCTESGDFTKGNKLITTCTFFLPKSEFKNSNGQVSYSSDESLANINNKYYIPLNEKEHSIKVTLKNLSRLNDDKAKEDSKDKTTPWTGTWTIDTKCSLKVTNRLYENGKYKFIYRPINLNNPFPNRSPGVNWYTWYITEGNKDKKTLEDSYKKREYYTELDNRTISTIKEYNKNHNYFSEVAENFFRSYIKEGGNS